MKNASSSYKKENDYKENVKVFRDQNGNKYYHLGKDSPATQTLGDIIGDQLEKIRKLTESPQKTEREDPVIFFYKKFMEVNNEKTICVVPYSQWFSCLKTIYDLVPQEERPILFYIKGFGVSISLDDIYRICEKRIQKLYGDERFLEMKEKLCNDEYESFVTLRVKDYSGSRLVDSPLLNKKGRESFTQIVLQFNPKVDFNLKSF